MHFSESGLNMPEVAAESSLVTGGHITDSEILGKVKIEQLRLSACRFVALAVDYPEVRIDDTGSIHFNFVQEPIPDITGGLSVEVKLTVPDFDGGSPLNDSTRQTLGIPVALESRPFTNDQVIELIGEVLELEVRSLMNVIPGVGNSAVRLTSFGTRTESGVHVCVESELYISIGCMNVYPMSVSDFGNFLYALKHGGLALALATLHRIYSESA
jgi:hypothetical protein